MSSNATRQNKQDPGTKKTTATAGDSTPTKQKHKPKLRGWIHLGMTPLSLAASIVLTVLAPTPATTWASAVYLACSLLLFGMSALYHLGNWGSLGEAILRRADHANIFLLIAGTYTPLSVALLTTSRARILLIIVWSGAIVGILMHIFWIQAPRWVYTPIYILLGWVAVAFMPDFYAASGAIVWLLVAGGLSYTLGAIVYACKWPEPSPHWFGHHEIFHVGTVAGWTCHCVATYLAVLGNPLH